MRSVTPDVGVDADAEQAQRVVLVVGVVEPRAVGVVLRRQRRSTHRCRSTTLPSASDSGPDGAPARAAARGAGRRQDRQASESAIAHADA